MELNFVDLSLRPSETRTWSARGAIARFDKKLESCYFIIISECPLNDTDYVPSKAMRISPLMESRNGFQSKHTSPLEGATYT